jgi:hypothetical protein
VKTPDTVICMNDEERRLLAGKGFFVRSTDGLSVFCPQGEVLTRKAVKSSGRVRYMKKSACYACSSPCFERTERKRWKEIDFSPSVSVKGEREKLLSLLEAK